MKISSGLKEGLKAAGALTVFAGLTFGLPIAGYYAGKGKHEAWKAEQAAREVQIQNQTRTNITGVIKALKFTPSSAYLGPGIGFTLDSDANLGFGPSMWSYQPNGLDAHLAFSLESTDAEVQVWQIVVDTRGRSDQVLADIANKLQQGATVKIAKGIEWKEGQLSVNLEDISVEK